MMDGAPEASTRKRRRCCPLCPCCLCHCRYDGFAASSGDLRAILEPVVAVFGLGGVVCLEISDARLRASRYADTGTHAVEATLAPAHASFALGAARQSGSSGGEAAGGAEGAEGAEASVRVSARAVASCVLQAPRDCRVALALDEERRHLCVSHDADVRLSAVATSRLALYAISGSSQASSENWRQLMSSPAPLQLSLRALASFVRRADDLSAVSCSLTQEASEDERHAAFLVLHCETLEVRGGRGEIELRVPLAYEAVSQSEAHHVEGVPVSALSDACRALEAVAQAGGEDAVSLAMEPWGVLLWYYSGARGLEVKVPILRYPRAEGS